MRYLAPLSILAFVAVLLLLYFGGGGRAEAPQLGEPAGSLGSEARDASKSPRAGAGEAEAPERQRAVAGRTLLLTVLDGEGQAAKGAVVRFAPAYVPGQDERGADLALEEALHLRIARDCSELRTDEAGRATIPFERDLHVLAFHEGQSGGIAPKSVEHLGEDRIEATLRLANSRRIEVRARTIDGSPAPDFDLELRVARQRELYRESLGRVQLGRTNAAGRCYLECADLSHGAALDVPVSELRYSVVATGFRAVSASVTQEGGTNTIVDLRIPACGSVEVRGVAQLLAGTPGEVRLRPESDEYEGELRPVSSAYRTVFPVVPLCEKADLVVGARHYRVRGPRKLGEVVRVDLRSNRLGSLRLEFRDGAREALAGEQVFVEFPESGRRKFSTAQLRVHDDSLLVRNVPVSDVYRVRIVRKLASGLSIAQADREVAGPAYPGHRRSVSVDLPVPVGVTGRLLMPGGVRMESGRAYFVAMSPSVDGGSTKRSHPIITDGTGRFAVDLSSCPDGSYHISVLRSEIPVRRIPIRTELRADGLTEIGVLRLEYEPLAFRGSILWKGKPWDPDVKRLTFNVLLANPKTGAPLPGLDRMVSREEGHFDVHAEPEQTSFRLVVYERLAGHRSRHLGGVTFERAEMGRVIRLPEELDERRPSLVDLLGGAVPGSGR